MKLNSRHYKVTTKSGTVYHVAAHPQTRWNHGLEIETLDVKVWGSNDLFFHREGISPDDLQIEKGQHLTGKSGIRTVTTSPIQTVEKVSQSEFYNAV